MDNTAMTVPVAGGGSTQFTLPETSLLEDQQLERQQRCREYLERDNRINPDMEALEQVVTQESPRLVISVDHIREFDAELATHLLAEPGEFIPAFETVVTEAGASLATQAGVAVDSRFKVSVGFGGSFGAQHITPRGLRARLLSRLVSIEGIVTRCSLVRPKVARSVHYAEGSKTFYAKNYGDPGSGTGFSSAYPTSNDKGEALTTEFGLSRYTDHQTVNIQEMPERAPPGQLPRGVDVVLDDDLVDSVKPGDRVAIVGVYRALGGKATTAASAIFRTVVVANAVRVFGAGSLAGTRDNGADVRDAGVPGAMALTDSDIRNIHMIAERPDAFELLAQSLAPSICGHTEIKRAVLLQQLSGVERNLENGTHIRGDINVLMVGDPSTAKSQMLRYVLRIAPLAIATTGRGSSGVGLTAAVVADRDTGERRLEAGAMVLADRGVVCIDEFDKMADADRVAIHEVMEQQTVTIAKAGIHTTLNARCSVLAAANPVYGRYDPRRPPHQNIALPDSLLSRFDLLFVVTDSLDEARDRTISSHVLRMHRYVPPGTEPGQPAADLLDRVTAAASMSGLQAPADDEGNGTGPCPVFEPYNEYLHAGVAAAAAPPRRGRGRRAAAAAASKREVLSTEFLRRFLYFAKNMVRPVLGSEAADDLASAYAELRAQASGQGLDDRGPTGAVQTTTPVTARTLETLIRLATAHAKLRLSSTVDAEDAEVAKSLLRFALFKEKLARAPRQNRSARPKQKRARTSDDSMSDISSEEETEQAEAPSRDGDLRPMQTAAPAANDNSMDVDAINDDRLALFKSQLSTAIAEHRLDASMSPWSFPEPFLSIINDGLSGSSAFSINEADQGLKAMEAENRLMFRDNMIIMM
ncbi:MCM DNA helicase complex subunit [Coemansia sp. RSA 990]|nr:ATP dependent DNA helicase [Coemansia mojavensis]KAJ1750109.1 MCM DNA helicase complex subunit [Coemansia sp. RSA 1821]KAJ1871601.1 MCM DNA helicase complex subunit [Coemansia sp. RSA 990]KAJ2671656.1 MCM DNA helicase complex subunit [Coemansia sp. RSA 1085]